MFVRISGSSCRKPSLLVAILALVVGATYADAQIISVPETGKAYSWGPGAIGGYQAYGESFTVPAGSPVLTSFTFNSLDSTSDTAISYQNEIYAFDPIAYVTPGSALYIGPILMVPPTGEVSDSFTPNVLLTPGDTYIAFITPAGISQASGNSTGEMGANDAQPYSGGRFFFAETGNSTDVNSYEWQTYSGNAAFTAYFGTAIPEPSSWFVMVGALTALTVWRVRKVLIRV